MKTQEETLEYALGWALQSMLREGYQGYDQDADEARTRTASTDYKELDSSTLEAVLASEQYQEGIVNMLNYLENHLVGLYSTADFHE